MANSFFVANELRYMVRITLVMITIKRSNEVIGEFMAVWIKPSPVISEVKNTL
jgi:hypothetical protein